MICKGLVRGLKMLEIWKTSRDHPNYSIIMISQNTEKNPGNSDSNEQPSAHVSGKNLQGIINNNIDDNDNNKTTTKKINHLFYMYDFKVICKNDGLEGLLNTVKRFSYDIKMQFDLGKCTKVTFKKGLLLKSKNITLDLNIEITELDHNKTYKYSEINEANGINHTMNKKNIR